MRIGQLQTTDTFDLTIGEGQIAITYNKGILTRSMFTTLQNFQNATDPLVVIDGAVAVLCTLLSGWDLEENDGGLVPITPERFETIDIELIMEIVSAIVERAFPNPKSVEPSDAS